VALKKAGLEFRIAFPRTGLVWQELDGAVREHLRNVNIQLLLTYPASDEYHHLPWHIVYPRSNQPASSRQFKASDLVSWEFDHPHLSTISQKVKNPDNSTVEMLFIGVLNKWYYLIIEILLKDHPLPAPSFGNFTGPLAEFDGMTTSRHACFPWHVLQGLTQQTQDVAHCLTTCPRATQGNEIIHTSSSSGLQVRARSPSMLVSMILSYMTWAVLLTGHLPLRMQMSDPQVAGVWNRQRVSWRTCLKTLLLPRPVIHYLCTHRHHRPL
jgi:hypothetical protein